MSVTAAEIEQVFREQYGRSVAVLVRLCGSIDAAEEAVQDAFTAALQRWPSAGLPPSPAGWIITAARNRAIDVARREASRESRHDLAALHEPADDCEEFDMDMHAIRDDRLRLIFTCCHPALALESQVALTLRLLGGLSTPEIARAFLVPETTMGQRIVRAKGKIRDAKIPFRIPEHAELQARVAAVLAVVYLVFNEGYTAKSGERLLRADLCEEAIRLTRQVSDLMPGEGEVKGLLALMLLTDARRAARVGVDNSLIPLAEQDRALWDSSLIEEGLSLVRHCVAANRPGYYQLQAAIQAVHCSAAGAGQTDWQQVVALYDQLADLTRSPIVELNRAVAVAEVHGPEAALALVEALTLDRYHLFHAIRADLLVRLKRPREAVAAYDAAIARSENRAEREFLGRKRNASLELFS
ncbi:MAG TPA: RNA polymerase sigma factor [Steroidobacteraceae bacterium]